jgi:uncharacterized protein YqhQ
MITPFEVYIVMQADSVGKVVGLISILLGVATLMCLLFGHIEEEEKAIAAGKKTAIALIISLAFSALLPSTKTAAAMIVIPAIVNNEALQKEAGDLYKIAKQALADAVAEEKKDD